MIVGGMAGAILAVNLVILAGVEDGYEASMIDVFDHSLTLGVVVVAVLIAGPISGLLYALRRRRGRDGQ